ncbi:hypothetical protein PCA31118_03063 [Pandoraea captiosa]|uniref:Uncharacterized protein n=1 Tax=Pandoraea captiosa TaxID=2508302 RepID=A0A5E5A935_9BURK|nr:hypothetical protein PCA31118_03063 [Pandoraea captiosa]
MPSPHKYSTRSSIPLNAATAACFLSDAVVSPTTGSSKDNVCHAARRLTTAGQNPNFSPPFARRSARFDGNSTSPSDPILRKSAQRRRLARAFSNCPAPREYVSWPAPRTFGTSFPNYPLCVTVRLVDGFFPKYDTGQRRHRPAIVPLAQARGSGRAACRTSVECMAAAQGRAVEVPAVEVPFYLAHDKNHRRR